MTSTMSRPSHHKAAETEPVPDTTRIGGVRVMTAGPYLELRADAQTLTGWRGRQARRRLAAEERRRTLAIKRAVDQSGFDVDGAQVPGSYGVAGPGGGRTNVVLRMPEWRTTTAQVAGGFWPFSIGASSPLLGTPLGSHLQTGQDFGCDPLSWFLAGLITAPTAFVLGLNGFGKSSLVRRLAEGNIAQGHTTLFLGDIKPDFAVLTHALGGQVITGGYGYQQINPLAAGGLGAALMRIDTEIADRTARGEDLENLPDLWSSVSADLRSRQVQTLAGLLEISRAGRVQDFEETLLSSALNILYTPKEQGGHGFDGAHPPILADLYAVLKEGNDTLLEDAAVGADDMLAYARVTANLRQSLRALIQGPLGKVLNGQTTEPLNLDYPAICVDVSRVPKGDRKLKAALLLVCWADGFGAVEGAHVLADAGLEERRTFQVIIDELWQVIGSGSGIVDRIDVLVRVENRGSATQAIFVTHSVADLSAFESVKDANKALGFLEKARLKFIGPVGPEELDRLSTVTHVNAAERELLTSAASTPPPSESVLSRLRAVMRHSGTAASSADRPRPHGQGVFLLKFGEDKRPGIPFRLNFTPAEETGVHNTNNRFDGVTARAGEASRMGDAQ